MGWSIDSRQTGLLVADALGMALRRRTLREGRIIHSDQGVQFASWVFSQKVTEAGLAPSVGAVGVPFDNAMVEGYWARMQVELLNRLFFWFCIVVWWFVRICAGGFCCGLCGIW